MPDYVQLPLWKPYDPQVNDYVIWDRGEYGKDEGWVYFCLLYTSPSPRDRTRSRMPSSA